MTKEEFIKNLENELDHGTLMTPKHDPANLRVTYSTYRTVIAEHLANDLDGFIKSEDYTVTSYRNTRFPATPMYFEIEPASGSTYSVPASGVPPYSLVPTVAVDRLVAVSGINQGWHLFGESSFNILQKVSTGDLVKNWSL